MTNSIFDNPEIENMIDRFKTPLNDLASLSTAVLKKLSDLNAVAGSSLFNDRVELNESIFRETSPANVLGLNQDYVADIFAKSMAMTTEVNEIVKPALGEAVDVLKGAFQKR